MLWKWSEFYFIGTTGPLEATSATQLWWLAGSQFKIKSAYTCPLERPPSSDCCMARHWSYREAFSEHCKSISHQLQSPSLSAGWKLVASPTPMKPASCLASSLFQRMLRQDGEKSLPSSTYFLRTAISFSMLLSLPFSAFLGMHFTAKSFPVAFSSAKTTSEKAPLWTEREKRKVRVRGFGFRKASLIPAQ